MSFRPGRSPVETDGTNWVTAVPGPPKGTKRMISHIALSNGAAAPVDITLALYDGTTYWVQWRDKSLASGDAEDPHGPYVLQQGDTFVAKLGGSPSAETQITCHWGDDREEGEGEN